MYCMVRRVSANVKTWMCCSWRRSWLSPPWAGSSGPASSWPWSLAPSAAQWIRHYINVILCLIIFQVEYRLSMAFIIIQKGSLYIGSETKRGGGAAEACGPGSGFSILLISFKDLHGLSKLLICYELAEPRPWQRDYSFSLSYLFYCIDH